VATTSPRRPPLAHDRERHHLDRFNRDKEPVALTLVEPVAVEVSADTAWSGRYFRHPLRVLRARPELSPTDITLPEILRPLGRTPANTAEQ
jgi:hypothetical protein